MKHLKTKKHDKKANKNICKICNKKFDFNSKYQRHLKNKNSCSQNNLITQITQMNPNESKMNPNESKRIQNESKMNPKYQCKYCNKNYSTNSHMNRHIKNVCKFKKDKILENEIKKLKEELKNNPKIINNIQNNNIQNNNNIHINTYGKEDIDYLQTKENIKLIKSKEDCGIFAGLLIYLKNKHMHPHYKQNWNIRVPSLKTSYIQIRVGKKWKTKLIDNIVDNNFTRGQLELQEIIETQACQEGREDEYGDAIYDSIEQKILDDIDKVTIEKLDFYVKKYKEVFKTYKADLYDLYINNKSHFK